MAYNRLATSGEVQSGATKSTIVSPKLLKDNYWFIGGNALSGTSNIGSTNNLDVAFIRNGVEAARMDGGNWTTATILKNLKIGVNGGSASIRFPYTASNQFGLAVLSDGTFRVAKADGEGSGSNVTFPLSITLTDRVGIGLSNPTSRLSNSSTTVTDESGLSTGSESFVWSTSLQAYSSVIYNSNTALEASGLLVKTFNSVGDAYIFKANSGLGAGTDRFVIASNGNVGINIAPPTLPSTKLEINSGTANVSGLRLTNLTSSSPAGVGQPIGVNATGNIVRIDVSGGTGTSVLANNGLGIVTSGSTSTVQLGGTLIQNTSILQGTYDYTNTRTGVSTFNSSFENKNILTNFSSLEGIQLYGNNNAGTATYSNIAVYYNEVDTAIALQTKKSTDSVRLDIQKERFKFTVFNTSVATYGNITTEFKSNNAATSCFEGTISVSNAVSGTTDRKKSEITLKPTFTRIGFYRRVNTNFTEQIAFEFSSSDSGYIGYVLKGLNIPTFAGAAAATTALYPTGGIFVDSTNGNALVML